GGSGGTGATLGKAGIGGTGGVLLGLDGFTAPASTSPLHTLQQDVINMVNGRRDLVRHRRHRGQRRARRHRPRRDWRGRR
ncbi:hypothetical protein, partial [Mycobacterium tuberculosis]|uniref:hypothetical protein n=1 Tax=Mycobacterium tuberculosis TaxID=1773 RepID=UPI000ABC0169